MVAPRRRQDATHRRPRLLRGPRTRLSALLPRHYLFHLVVPEQPRAAILRYYLQGQVLGLPVAPDDRADHPTQLRLVPLTTGPNHLAHACLFDPHSLRYPTGRYLRCHILKQCPTKIMACSMPIPSSLSLSYSATKAHESVAPESM